MKVHYGNNKTPHRNDFDSSIASEEYVVAALIALYDAELFSEYDSVLLTRICETVLHQKVITDRQVALARAKLNRYWKVLHSLDLEASRVPFTVQTHLPAASIKLGSGELNTSACDGNRIRLHFNYNESMNARVKAVPGRTFHTAGHTAYWTVPAVPTSIKMLINMGFPIPKEYQQVTHTQEYNFDYTGIKRTLRPYQIQGVERMAGDLNLRALLADEMGLGKTPQALVAAWVRRQDAFPLLVMCPGSLKWNWAKEIGLWLPNVAVRILEGMATRRTAYRIRQEREITIVNWDILADRNTKNGVNQGWAALLKDTPFQMVILDECQDIKNEKTKRTKAVKEVCKPIPNILALSGTPIESRPAEFWPILSLLDKTLFASEWAFKTRYCGEYKMGESNNFKGASNTVELNEILTDRIMIRRQKIDVLPDLPPKVRQAIPVHIDMKEYTRAENDLRSFLQESKGLPPSERNAGGLAHIEKCKQAAMRGKLPFAIDYIESYLSSGKKLVVFGVHVFVMDALENAFKGRVVRMDGSVIGEKRQKAVDAFQGDDSIRLFIGTIKPAGRGHTLTEASDTLTLEFEWTPGKHDQAEDRVHRIGQTASSVNALYMIAEGTIDEYFMEIIDTKRDVLSQVLDGKEAESVAMLSYLMKKYGG